MTINTYAEHGLYPDYPALNDAQAVEWPRRRSNHGRSYRADLKTCSGTAALETSAIRRLAAVLAAAADVQERRGNT